MIRKKKRYGDKARWRMLKIWDTYDFCNNNSCDLPFLAPLASSGPTTIRYPAGLRVFMGSTPLWPGTILTFRSWRFSYWQKSSGAPKLKPSTTPNKQITAITQTKSIFSNAIQIIFGKRTSRNGNRKCKRWLFSNFEFPVFLKNGWRWQLPEGVLLIFICLSKWRFYQLTVWLVVHSTCTRYARPSAVPDGNRSLLRIMSHMRNRQNKCLGDFV